MPFAQDKVWTSAPEGAKGERLSEAAKRALAEAAERRRHHGNRAAEPKEANGRGGLDPVRYGDWEVKGIATDF